MSDSILLCTPVLSAPPLLQTTKPHEGILVTGVSIPVLNHSVCHVISTYEFLLTTAMQNASWKSTWFDLFHQIIMRHLVYLHFYNSWTSAKLSEQRARPTLSFWHLTSMVLEENRILCFSSLHQGYRCASHSHKVSDLRKEIAGTKLVFYLIQNSICWRTIVPTDPSFVVTCLCNHEWKMYK